TLVDIDVRKNEFHVYDQAGEFLGAIRQPRLPSGHLLMSLTSPGTSWDGSRDSRRAHSQGVGVPGPRVWSNARKAAGHTRAGALARVGEVTRFCCSVKSSR